jgi:hypothetical protein
MFALTRNEDLINTFRTGLNEIQQFADLSGIEKDGLSLKLTFTSGLSISRDFDSLDDLTEGLLIATQSELGDAGIQTLADAGFRGADNIHEFQSINFRNGGFTVQYGGTNPDGSGWGTVDQGSIAGQPDYSNLDFSSLDFTSFQTDVSNYVINNFDQILHDYQFGLL